MIHLRRDYDRFQDPEGKIPENEPVFIIRGQDFTAPDVIYYWGKVARAWGASPELCHRVAEFSDYVARWQQTYGCKVPDTDIDQLREIDELPLIPKTSPVSGDDDAK